MEDDKIQSAFKYFDENGYNVHQIITRGRRKGITESCIIEGMINIFERIESGEVIKPIQIVWAVWEAAKKVQGKEYIEWCRSRDEFMADITDLKSKILGLKRKISKMEIALGLTGGLLAILLTLIINWLFEHGLI